MQQSLEERCRELEARLKALEAEQERLVKQNEELRQTNQQLRQESLERQRMEQAWRESEERYRTLVESSPNAIAVHAAGQVVFVNPEAVRLMGASSAGELLGRPVLEFVHPDFREIARQRVQAIYEKKGAAEPLEEQFLRLDGQMIEVEVVGTMVDYEGQPASQIVFRDITKRKRAEEALQESEARFRELAELLPQVVYETNAAGVLTYANRRAFDLFGYTRQDFEQGLNTLQMLAPAERARATESIQEILMGQEPGGDREYRALRKDGATFPIAIYSAPIIRQGRAVGLRGLIVDITQQKQAEAALRESEAKYRTLVEQSLQGVVIAQDNPVRLRFANRPMQAITGYSPEELESFGFQQLAGLIHPEDRDVFFRNFRDRLAGKKISPRHEYRIIHKKGDVRWIESYSSWLEYEGAPATLTAFLDITERKQAELALQESEERYRTLFEQANDAIFLNNLEDEIIDVNSRACELLGYTRQELLAMKVPDLQAPEVRSQAGSVIKQELEHYGGTPFETVDLHRDGRRIPVEVCTSRVTDQAGSLVLSIVRDITERKRAEEALRASETMFKALVKQSSVSIQIFDPSGNSLEVNDAWEKLWGIPKEILVDYNILQDEQLTRLGVMSYIERAFTGERITLPETQYDAVDTVGQGYKKWVRASFYPIKDDEEKIQNIILMNEDITERKQAQEALGASELKYRTLVEHIPAITYIAALDETSTTLYISPRQIEEILGFAPEEWQPAGHDIWFRQLHPADRERVLAETTAGYTSAAPFVREYRMLTRAEEVVWIRDEAVVVRDEAGQPLFLQGVMSDISALKQAEEEIRHRNRQLTLLNHIIAAASAANLEPEALLDTACRELARAFDVPRAAAALLNPEKTAATVVAEYGAAGREAGLNQTIPVEGNPAAQHLLSRKTPLVADSAPDDPRLAPLHRLLRQRGTVSLLILPLLVGDEVSGGLAMEAAEPRPFAAQEVSLAWNVAEQVGGALGRARLDRERRQLSAAIEQAAEGVVITDTAGDILYANSAFERISGYSRAELFGRNLHLLKSGQQDAAFHEQMWTTLTAGQTWQGRLVNKKKDGTRYTEETTIRPVRDEQGAIVNYVAVRRDVTRELHLEEQLLQSQKMEAVGQLAGGVAHDFNNMLTAINGFAELMQLKLQPDDPLWEMTERILGSGRRAADLVGQLLTFSRKQVIQPQVLDLNSMVSDLEKMLGRLIGEDIHLETTLAADLWPVKADPTQIGQVIINLAVNARDAMPQGGGLTIETANVVLDEEYVADHLGVPPGEYVRLAVSDTGVGMSREVQARIFEPFFTTKGVGQGTGLGLATVYGIVKQSHGEIQVYSETGQGTTFKIYLPRTTEAAQPSPPPQVGQMRLTGDETILLVEDDEDVRGLTGRVLHSQGYYLLEARSGEEALRLAASHAVPIHLLLTDVVLPGLGGKALGEQLAATRPDLKVIYMSGYTDNAIARHGVLEPGVAFLQKPFSPGELARQVRRVLDR